MRTEEGLRKGPGITWCFPHSFPPTVGAAGGHLAAPCELLTLPRVSPSSSALSRSPGSAGVAVPGVGLFFLELLLRALSAPFAQSFGLGSGHSTVLNLLGLPGARTLLSRVQLGVPAFPDPHSSLNTGTEQGKSPGSVFAPGFMDSPEEQPGLGGGGLGVSEELVQRDRSSTHRV